MRYKKIYNTLKIKKQLALIDEHTLEVVKKSSASMVVKVAGMATGMGVSIFLGRTIGAEGLGIINLANRIVSLLIVFTIFGFDTVLIKNIAIAYERQDWQRIANNLFTSFRFNGILALSASIFGLSITSLLINDVFHEPDLHIPLIIAFAMIVPQTVSRIFAAGLSGFRKIWQSSLVNDTLSIAVVGLGLLICYLSNLKINIVNVAILYALGRLVVTGTMSIYWKKLFHFSGSKQWNLKPMVKMALPLLLASVTSIIAINADTIMLGWLSNTHEVGLYSVAARLALLTSFFLQVSNASISPKLATLYAENKIEEMKKMVKRVTLGLIIIAFVFLSIFVFGGVHILGLWGNEFKEAYWILVILTIGQFINISTGSAGLILTMCGFEKIRGYLSLLSVTLNLILNYFFIRHYGAVGAAIATAVTVGGENIVKVILAKNKTGILTIPKI